MGAAAGCGAAPIRLLHSPPPPPPCCSEFVNLRAKENEMVVTLLESFGNNVEHELLNVAAGLQRQEERFQRQEECLQRLEERLQRQEERLQGIEHELLKVAAGQERQGSLLQGMEELMREAMRQQGNINDAIGRQLGQICRSLERLEK